MAKIDDGTLVRVRPLEGNSEEEDRKKCVTFYKKFNFLWENRPSNMVGTKIDQVFLRIF